MVKTIDAVQKDRFPSPIGANDGEDFPLLDLETDFP
jgi:hypothetical protein